MVITIFYFFLTFVLCNYIIMNKKNVMIFILITNMTPPWYKSLHYAFHLLSHKSIGTCIPMLLFIGFKIIRYNSTSLIIIVNFPSTMGLIYYRFKSFTVFPVSYLSVGLKTHNTTLHHPNPNLCSWLMNALNSFAFTWAKTLKYSFFFWKSVNIMFSIRVQSTV